MTHGRFPGVWRGGMSRDCARTRVEGHALGISNAQLSEPGQTEADVIACFYLDWMYTEIMRRKKMTDYRIGDWDTGIDATFEDNTRVTAGHSGAGIEAWYEGIPIARGDDRFLPGAKTPSSSLVATAEHRNGPCQRAGRNATST